MTCLEHITPCIEDQLHGTSIIDFKDPQSVDGIGWLAVALTDTVADD